MLVKRCTVTFVTTIQVCFASAGCYVSVGLLARLLRLRSCAATEIAAAAQPQPALHVPCWCWVTAWACYCHDGPALLPAARCCTRGNSRCKRPPRRRPKRECVLSEKFTESVTLQNSWLKHSLFFALSTSCLPSHVDLMLSPAIDLRQKCHSQSNLMTAQGKHLLLSKTFLLTTLCKLDNGGNMMPCISLLSRTYIYTYYTGSRCLKNLGSLPPCQPTLNLVWSYYADMLWCCSVPFCVIWPSEAAGMKVLSDEVADAWYRWHWVAANKDSRNSKSVIYLPSMICLAKLFYDFWPVVCC